MSKPIEAGAVDRRVPSRDDFNRLVDRVARLSRIQDLLVGEVRRLQAVAEPNRESDALLALAEAEAEAKAAEAPTEAPPAEKAAEQ